MTEKSSALVLHTSPKIALVAKTTHWLQKQPDILKESLVSLQIFYCFKNSDLNLTQT